MQFSGDVTGHGLGQDRTLVLGQVLADLVQQRCQVLGGGQQPARVKIRDGALDQGWEMAGVVVQDAGEPVLRVGGVLGGGPQLPELVPCLVEPR